MENIDTLVFNDEPDVGSKVIERSKERKRKANYSRYEETRLRCKKKLANLANTFISILETLSEKELFHISTTKIDDKDDENKIRKSRYWDGDDSFYTPWNIRINGEMDVRIFTLAYLLTDLRKVKIAGLFPNEDKVLLKWQRPEEIGRLMANYGNLLARKNRLKSYEQEILAQIPTYTPDIYQYLSERS